MDACMELNYEGCMYNNYFANFLIIVLFSSAELSASQPAVFSLTLNQHQPPASSIFSLTTN